MPHEKSRPVSHILSFLSFSFITANLLLWIPLLAVLALLKIVYPGNPGWMFPLVDWIYRAAVRVDAWWLRRIVGIEFDIEDLNRCLQDLTRTDQPIVISNHRSWFDIFILQTLITGDGPIIQFVVKKELLWVPVVGWICFLLNFPRLSRSGGEKRLDDLNRIREATGSSNEGGALLVFPEGTRFTTSKHRSQQSRYRHLLNPRPGGFRVIHETLSSDTRVIDVSICYQPEDDDCWRCLGGRVASVKIKIDVLTLGEIEDSNQWLNDRWSQKDLWLAGHRDG